jgi:hypothetical protein
MDGVRVHYGSNAPAQLGAYAYAQGNQIHVAPGQEKHLPHEAWHVVQQKQGRVRPTIQLASGTPVNDDDALENEADVMGARALSAGQAVEADETASLKMLAAPAGERGIAQREVIATKHNDAGTFTFDHKSNTKTLDDIFATVEVEISYKLKDSAPDESRLYLSQIVQSVVLETDTFYDFAKSGKDAEKTEAARDLVRTTGARGEKAGYLIDRFYGRTGATEQFAEQNAPRTSRLDEQRSVAYNTTGAHSHGHDGLKKASTGSNVPATLKDTPGWGKPMKMSFETVALGQDKAHFGTLPWNVVLGKKSIEPVITVEDATSTLSKTFTEARFNFNEFFRNSGAATSPERFNALTDIEGRGLSGIPEAVLTLDKLVAQAERVSGLSASTEKTSMLAELKELIGYRFAVLDGALEEASGGSEEVGEEAGRLKGKVAEFTHTSEI